MSSRIHPCRIVRSGPRMPYSSCITTACTKPVGIHLIGMDSRSIPESFQCRFVMQKKSSAGREISCLEDWLYWSGSAISARRKRPKGHLSGLIAALMQIASSTLSIPKTKRAVVCRVLLSGSKRELQVVPKMNRSGFAMEPLVVPRWNRSGLTLEPLVVPQWNRSGLTLEPLVVLR